MLSFLIFLFILGILIIVHEFGHFIAAKKIGVKVEKFSLGFGPAIFIKKKHDTEYSVSAIPLGGYVKLAGDNLEEFKGNNFEFLTQPRSKRFWIIVLGPLLNYILGFLCFWFVFFVGYPALTTRVGGLLDGFGAKEAGIQVGDKIIAVDEKKVDYWEDLQRIIQSKKEAMKVKLSILRNNQEYIIYVNIKEKKIDDPLGQKHSVGLLGITPFEEVVKVRHGLFESFILTTRRVWSLTAITYRALWRMITGKLTLRESITGPLGMFYITSKTANLGIIALLHLVAILNVSLAIFNLLPFPVLDGGHIALLGLEKIRGRLLGVKAERMVTQIGLTFIITLAIIVTYNDLARLFGDKIAKFFK